ncbi:hypothetical protein ACJIZ3_010916 [Penstemon smallii]|uniref:Uncharacterized protein n=1 Tax=Penstemon smallii TaxID=265156 RepID=A0ABD3UHM3_9LAMI
MSINGGEFLPLIKVIEYLETSMSTNLLCKFPDNSAFDFDYTQSSIWSPLLPRPVDSFSHDCSLEISRKLMYDEYEHVGLLENTKKMAANIKRKFTNVVSDNIYNYRNMKKTKRRRKSFEFSPVVNSSSPTPRKAWAKVMKVASKHFKKKYKKKDISNVHFDISN